MTARCPLGTYVSQELVREPAHQSTVVRQQTLWPALARTGCGQKPPLPARTVKGGEGPITDLPPLVCCEGDEGAMWHVAQWLLHPSHWCLCASFWQQVNNKPTSWEPIKHQTRAQLPRREGSQSAAVGHSAMSASPSPSRRGRSLKHEPWQN